VLVSVGVSVLATAAVTDWAIGILPPIFVYLLAAMIPFFCGERLGIILLWSSAIDKSFGFGACLGSIDMMFSF